MNFSSLPNTQQHCTQHTTRNADNAEDNEDKNLSWLFNFRLDDIANLSPEIKRKRTNNNTNSSNSNTINHSNVENHQQQQQQHHQQPLQSYYNPVQQLQPQFEDVAQSRSSKDPCIEDDLNVAENIVISSNAPPYSSHT